MAEQETTVPLDDRGMLADIMADRTSEPAPEATPEAPEPAADVDGRLRGSDGRFVAKQTDTPAAATQQPEQQPTTPQPTDDKTDQPPSWRLREMREARDAERTAREEAQRQSQATQQQLQALQRELAELRKPAAPPVDFFENPDAALQQRLVPLEERFAQLQSRLLLNSSRAMAVAVHGANAVQEMETAIDKASRENHPEMSLLAAQMRASDDPVQIAMQWHQRTKLQSEVGNDLNAYHEKLLANPEFLAKAVAKATGQAQQAAAQPGARPAISLPPSINRASGAGLNNSDPTDDADMSDRGIFRHAMASPVGGRRR